MFPKSLWISLILYTAFGNFASAQSILVFSKTEGFRHDAAIRAGKQALLEMGQQYRFRVDTTENANKFTVKNLQQYDAIVFLNTTGNVLSNAQQKAMQQFIQQGNGFVGIHAAADTEYNWKWYGRLVGGYFDGHPNNPNVRTGTFQITDTTHVATENLPLVWQHTDEFYDYKELNSAIQVLILADETSYNWQKMGEYHPIAWYHTFEGGRAFYTGFGHTAEAFSDSLFLQHLWGGVQYVLRIDQ